MYDSISLGRAVVLGVRLLMIRARSLLTVFHDEVGMRKLLETMCCFALYLLGGFWSILSLLSP